MGPLSACNAVLEAVVRRPAPRLHVSNLTYPSGSLGVLSVRYQRSRPRVAALSLARTWPASPGVPRSRCPVSPGAGGVLRPACPDGISVYRLPCVTHARSPGGGTLTLLRGGAMSYGDRSAAD